MQNQIRYMGDGQKSAWFLPFPVCDARDITVARAIAGEERVLAAGVDFQLSGQYLHAFLPLGATLSISLNQAPETVEARAAEAPPAYTSVQPLYTAAAPASAPVQSAEPANDTAARLEANLARSDALIRDAEAQCRIILAEAREQARELIASASQTVEAGIKEKEDKINANVARAEGSALETADHLSRAATAAMQAEEAAAAINASAANMGDCCQACADQAELAQKSADIAWDYAHAAVHAACMTSQHHFRPGIAAVHSLAEINCCAHGLFIINPHISHSPTPFMGVWPVANVSQATWDGVFFIGQPYPCPCAEPPKCPCPPKPCLPEPPDNPGDADDWQPCGHKHDAQKCACAGGQLL